MVLEVFATATSSPHCPILLTAFPAIIKLHAIFILATSLYILLLLLQSHLLDMKSARVSALMFVLQCFQSRRLLETLLLFLRFLLLYRVVRLPKRLGLGRWLRIVLLIGIWHFHLVHDIKS